MADNDQSIYTIRYNQITQGLEGFGGGSPMWTSLVLSADGTQPGGSTKNVQYNNSGSFAGSSTFNWDNVNTSLQIGTGATSPNPQAGNNSPGIDLGTNGSITAAGYVVYEFNTAVSTNLVGLGFVGAGSEQNPQDLGILTYNPNNTDDAGSIFLSAGFNGLGSVATNLIVAGPKEASAPCVQIVGGKNLGAFSGNPSAILQVDSTTQGVLPPRLTTVQRNAISSPAEGLTVYNTDTKRLESWSGSAWTGSSTPNVQSFVDSTGLSTTQSTPQATPTTVTITPSSSSAVIKISVSAGMSSTSIAVSGINVILFKDGTAVLPGNRRNSSANAGSSAFHDQLTIPCAFVWLDAPGDTNPHTYTVYIYNDDGATSVRWVAGNADAVIIAEEIH